MLWQHILFTLLTACAVKASCLHGTSILPRETAGGLVKISEFGYTGLWGPLNWAGLTEKNSACAKSSTQSPINIDDSVELAQIIPQITIENVEEAEFENLGTTVEVIVNGTAAVGERIFNLKQFHFHTPSEHRINEEYFPLEVHMVHEAAGESPSTLFDILIK
jgi:carbonic anhydrase